MEHPLSGSKTETEGRPGVKAGYRGRWWGWEYKCFHFLETGRDADSCKQGDGNCEGNLKKKMIIHKHRRGP